MALTEGVINQDIKNLPNHRRSGDFYPWKPDFDYTPEPILSTRWQ
jgi:microcystin degradation protein MlrC